MKCHNRKLISDTYDSFFRNLRSTREKIRRKIDHINLEKKLFSLKHWMITSLNARTHTHTLSRERYVNSFPVVMHADLCLINFLFRFSTAPTSTRLRSLRESINFDYITEFSPFFRILSFFLFSTIRPLFYDWVNSISDKYCQIRRCLLLYSC